MKTLRHAFAAVCLAATLIPTGDAAAASAAADSAPAAARSLYDRLGGEKAITAVVESFIKRLAADPVTGPRFAGANIPRLRRTLIEQVCEATGGPQKYTGMDMRTAHAGMNITGREFNALANAMVATLKQFKVPARERGELMGALAAMKNDIVQAPVATSVRLARLEGALARIEAKLDRVGGAGPGGAAVPPTAASAAVAARETADAPKPTAWSDDEVKLSKELVTKFETATAREANAEASPLVGLPLAQTRFTGPDGDVLDLKDFAGRNNVVLVIMRGYAGSVCITCSSQLVALSNQAKAFADRDAKVFVVYPGQSDTVPAFIESVRSLKAGFEPPFKLLLDADLAAVKSFMIEGSLAKPTTLVLDKRGVVRWAYVGAQPADRPGVPAILAQLDRLAK